MRWYEKIIRAHTAVTDAVSHGGRMQSERYFVWSEDGVNDFIADGRHGGRVVSGYTDLFTKTEFDPWADQLDASFNASPDIAWSRGDTVFEEETGFWHTDWEWEVLDNGQI